MSEKINGISLNNIKFNNLYSKVPKKDYSPFKFDFPKINKIRMETKSEQLYNEWSQLVPNLSLEFFDEVVEISKNLKCSPDDLTAIMYCESRLNPSATSSDGKYHGLIQMKRKSLKNCIDFSKQKYGENSPIKEISLEDYKKLPKEKQLKYSEAYIEMVRDKQGMSGKKLTGEYIWAMIKSPKLAKDKTSKGEHFRKKLQTIINETKNLAETNSTPFYLKRC